MVPSKEIETCSNLRWNPLTLSEKLQNFFQNNHCSLQRAAYLKLPKKFKKKITYKLFDFAATSSVIVWRVSKVGVTEQVVPG